VRILPKCTTKGARCIFTWQRPLLWGKANARHRSLPCVICDSRQRKGVDGRPRGDDVTPSLLCAAEHARERGILCRAPRGSAHGKEWSRRTVDHFLCRASSGAAHDKGWSMAHGGLWSLSCATWRGARQRLVQAPGAPVPLSCVFWPGARQRMVNLSCVGRGAQQRDYSGSHFSSLCCAPAPRRTTN
jgi:hypothetical protein